MKNKMELTIGICVGSSIVRRSTSARVPNLTVCHSKSPLLLYRYLLSSAGCEYFPPTIDFKPEAYIRRTHHDLTLFFADFETVVLFVSVLLVNFLIQCVPFLLFVCASLICFAGMASPTTWKDSCKLPSTLRSLAAHTDFFRLITLYLVIALACTLNYFQPNPPHG